MDRTFTIYSRIFVNESRKYFVFKPEVKNPINESMHSMIWQSRAIRYVSCQPNMQITFLENKKRKYIFSLRILMIMLMESNSSLEVVSCKTTK